MSRGARRAGAGRGAAAVQLLVTLSFLPRVVEAQVSQGPAGWGRGAGRGRWGERAAAGARGGSGRPRRGFGDRLVGGP